MALKFLNDGYFAGKVGIGTESPNRLLHLLTTTTDETQQLLIQNGHSGDAAIMFNISGDTYSLGIDNSDSDKFKLSYGNLGTNDRLVIDSSGNVGIGTAIPSEKLEVTGNVKVTGAGGITIASFAPELNLTANNSGSSTVNFGDASSYNIARIYYDHTNNYMDFKINAAERMRIDSSGNVGIGTVSPSEKLEVAGQYGNTKLNGHVVAYTRAAGNYLWASAVGGDLRFTVNGNLVGSPAMMISTAGNVGINTTSPNSKLDVRRSGSGVALELIQTSGNANDFIDLKMIAGNTTQELWVLY